MSVSIVFFFLKNKYNHNLPILSVTTDKTEVRLQLLAQWEIKHFQSDIFSSEQWNLSDIKRYLLNTSNPASLTPSPLPLLILSLWHTLPLTSNLCLPLKIKTPRAPFNIDLFQAHISMRSNTSTNLVTRHVNLNWSQYFRWLHYVHNVQIDTSTCKYS